MWRYYNNNPDGLNVGDCVIRAISAATGMSWRTVHKALCDLSGEMSDWPNADRVWWTFMEQIGFAKKRLIDQCPQCYTVEDFCRDHQRGIYILGPHEHAVCIIDGDYYDSWQSGRTVPTYYFRRL